MFAARHAFKHSFMMWIALKGAKGSEWRTAGEGEGTFAPPPGQGLLKQHKLEKRGLKGVSFPILHGTKIIHIQNLYQLSKNPPYTSAFIYNVVLQYFFVFYFLKIFFSLSLIYKI